MYQLAALVDTCREAALQHITVDIHWTTPSTPSPPSTSSPWWTARTSRRRNVARVRGAKDWETFASTFPNMMEELQLSLTTLWLRACNLQCKIWIPGVRTEEP